MARSLASAVSVLDNCLCFFGGVGWGLFCWVFLCFLLVLPSFFLLFWGRPGLLSLCFSPPPTEVSGHPLILPGSLHTCMSLSLSLFLPLLSPGSAPLLFSSPLSLSLSLPRSCMRISIAKGTGLEESVGTEDPASLTQSDIVK